MLQFSDLTIEIVVANQSEAMEANTISKNGQSSKSPTSSGNFLLVVAVLVMVIFTMVSCGDSGISGNKGDKILIVEIKGENVSVRNETVSSETLVKKSLEKGGSIVLDIDIIRKIDDKFDAKYSASDSDGKFYTRPAILNYVGGQGWHLLQVIGSPGNTQYFFTKTR